MYCHFWKMNISIFTSQNHKITEWWKFKGPLGPSAPNCSSRATWSRVPGPCPGVFGRSPRRRLQSLSGQPVPALSHISWCSEGIPCLWDCTYCLLSWHWALSENGLLYTFPLDICTHWWDWPWVFCFLGWTGWHNLSL